MEIVMNSKVLVRATAQNLVEAHNRMKFDYLIK